MSELYRKDPAQVTKYDPGTKAATREGIRWVSEPDVYLIQETNPRTGFLDEYWVSEEIVDRYFEAGDSEEVVDDYDAWTKDQLQNELVLRDLPKSGNVAELIARLRENDAIQESREE